eukprot:SM000098S25108  [mRNA]  locus=s98:192945:197332:- [translate_table: standard]
MARAAQAFGFTAPIVQRILRELEGAERPAEPPSPPQSPALRSPLQRDSESLNKENKDPNGVAATQARDLDSAKTSALVAEVDDDSTAQEVLKRQVAALQRDLCEKKQRLSQALVARGTAVTEGPGHCDMTVAVTGPAPSKEQDAASAGASVVHEEGSSGQWIAPRRTAATAGSALGVKQQLLLSPEPSLQLPSIAAPRADNRQSVSLCGASRAAAQPGPAAERAVLRLQRVEQQPSTEGFTTAERTRSLSTGRVRRVVSSNPRARRTRQSEGDVQRSLPLEAAALLLQEPVDTDAIAGGRTAPASVSCSGQPPALHSTCDEDAVELPWRAGRLRPAPATLARAAVLPPGPNGYGPLDLVQPEPAALPSSSSRGDGGNGNGEELPLPHARPDRGGGGLRRLKALLVEAVRPELRAAATGAGGGDMAATAPLKERGTSDRAAGHAAACRQPEAATSAPLHAAASPVAKPLQSLAQLEDDDNPPVDDGSGSCGGDIPDLHELGLMAAKAAAAAGRAESLAPASPDELAYSYGGPTGPAPLPVATASGQLVGKCLGDAEHHGSMAGLDKAPAPLEQEPAVVPRLCLVHPLPVLALAVHANDGWLRVAACCGHPGTSGTSERRVFVYELPLEPGGEEACRLLAAFVLHVDCDAGTRQLEQQGLCFVQGGSALAILDALRVEPGVAAEHLGGITRVTLACLAGEHTNAPQTDDSGQEHLGRPRALCLLAVAADKVVAGAEDGGLACWAMDGSPRGPTMVHRLPKSDSGGAAVAVVQLAMVPNCACFVLALDSAGNVAIWSTPHAAQMNAAWRLCSCLIVQIALQIEHSDSTLNEKLIVLMYRQESRGGHTGVCVPWALPIGAVFVCLLSWRSPSRAEGTEATPMPASSLPDSSSSWSDEVELPWPVDKARLRRRQRSAIQARVAPTAVEEAVWGCPDDSLELLFLSTSTPVRHMPTSESASKLDQLQAVAENPAAGSVCRLVGGQLQVLHFLGQQTAVLVCGHSEAVAGCIDGTLHVWDTCAHGVSPTPVMDLSGAPISALQLDSTQPVLCTGSEDGRVMVYSF